MLHNFNYCMKIMQHKNDYEPVLTTTCSREVPNVEVISPLVGKSLVPS